MCSQGPATIESEQKKLLANTGTAEDQQEKAGMPNAIISGGEISESQIYYRHIGKSD